MPGVTVKTVLQDVKN